MRLKVQAGLREVYGSNHIKQSLIMLLPRNSQISPYLIYLITVNYTKICTLIVIYNSFLK